MNGMKREDYDLAEITRLLLDMRNNCLPKEGNTYDDLKRNEKYAALNAAIDLINNPSVLVNGDLISREWVLKEIRAHKAHAQSFRQVTYATGYMCGLSVLEGQLADAPAVDAVPVVHGRWIWVKDKEDPNVEHLRCSACMGSGVDEADGYCRHCGAKMDLEEVPKDV